MCTYEAKVSLIMWVIVQYIVLNHLDVELIVVLECFTCSKDQCKGTIKVIYFFKKVQAELACCVNYTTVTQNETVSLKCPQIQLVVYVASLLLLHGYHWTCRAVVWISKCIISLSHFNDFLEFSPLLLYKSRWYYKHLV